MPVIATAASVHATRGRNGASVPAAATISGEGVSPAAIAIASGSPPGSAAASAAAEAAALPDRLEASQNRALDQHVEAADVQRWSGRRRRLEALQIVEILDFEGTLAREQLVRARPSA